MFNHVTVLLNEAVEGLNVKPDGIYVDCTLGGAGHSSLILKQLTTGHLYCFDQDLSLIHIFQRVLLLVWLLLSIKKYIIKKELF